MTFRNWIKHPYDWLSRSSGNAELPAAAFITDNGNLLACENHYFIDKMTFKINATCVI